MKWLTKEQEATMPRIEVWKHKVMAYLTDESNNQIQGFYDWSGYWTRKNEVFRRNCQGIVNKDNQEQIALLPQIFDYMSSITIEDIARMTREDGREYLAKYGAGYFGDHDEWHNFPGGHSNAEKSALRQAYANTSTTFVISNYKILRRTRWHVGAYLNRLTKQEVIDHVNAVAADELNSAFWRREDKSQINGTNYSNAIFRLEICQTWLAGTDHEDVIKTKLGEVASQYLAYKGITDNTLSLNEYRQTVEMLWQAEKNLQTAKAEHALVVAELEKSIHDLRQQTRDADKDINGIKLTEIMKLKAYESEVVTMRTGAGKPLTI